MSVSWTFCCLWNLCQKKGAESLHPNMVEQHNFKMLWIEKEESCSECFQLLFAYQCHRIMLPNRNDHQTILSNQLVNLLCRHFHNLFNVLTAVQCLHNHLEQMYEKCLIYSKASPKLQVWGTGSLFFPNFFFFFLYTVQENSGSESKHVSFFS